MQAWQPAVQLIWAASDIQHWVTNDSSVAANRATALGSGYVLFSFPSLFCSPLQFKPLEGTPQGTLPLWSCALYY